MTRRVRLIAVASVLIVAAFPAMAGSQFIRDDFNTGYERASQQADCPGVLAGAPTETRDDTFGCLAALADSNPFRGSWVDVRVKPGFTLVYVNGRYAGTVSFWVNGDTAKVTTARGTLVKAP
jgi:hypothetical protein